MEEGKEGRKKGRGKKEERKFFQELEITLLLNGYSSGTEDRSVPSILIFTFWDILHPLLYLNLTWKLAIDNISVPKNSVYVTGTVLPFNPCELGCFLPWKKEIVQMWLKDLYTAKKKNYFFPSLSLYSGHANAQPRAYILSLISLQNEEWELCLYSMKHSFRKLGVRTQFP